jgi:uroporphyrinogen-III synthase
MTSRPVYLISITPYRDPDIIHLPLLGTQWLKPSIDFLCTDGIIFTSKNGVDALQRIDPAWKHLPVLCVGKATEERAIALGADVLASADGYGDGLYDIIRRHYPEKRWLYARPKVIASDFAASLRHIGVTVNEAIVYETVCRAENIDVSLADDAVLIFTSPSALQCFHSRFDILPTHRIVVIGKTTAKSLSGYVVHIAPEPTVASCVAVAKQLAKEPK